MIEQKRLVPKRRFEGFMKGWTEQKLSSLSDVRDGTHDSPQYYLEGHPFITSKNVKDGMINYDDVQYISDTDFQKINKRSKVDKNDILMGMIGTIGNLALITETPDFAIKNVALIKDTGSVSYLYLYHYLESPYIGKQLFDDMDGGTQKFISLNRIRNLLIKTPEVEEQQKIGQFFKHLDKMIALEQRKIDKTKALKSAYLAEMFPAEGERVPKRRFEGFNDKWRERSFDDEIELYNGLTYSPNDVKQTGTFVLRSSNVQDGEIVNADDVYVNSEVVNSSNVRKGDIIVVVRNGSRSLIGKHAQVKTRMDKTVIGAFMTGIRSNQSNFINALLDTQKFKDEIDKNLGATINQITNSMFKNMFFSFPSIEEQEIIGSFFEKIDDTIKNHQQKLAKLKATKQAYLHEMFV